MSSASSKQWEVWRQKDFRTRLKEKERNDIVPEFGFGKWPHESKVNLQSCKQATLRDSSQQVNLSLCYEQPSKDEQSRKHE